MIPMAGIGWQELVIVLVIIVVLFGGARLAGLGKASGQAIREFKDELSGDKHDAPTSAPADATSDAPK